MYGLEPVSFKNGSAVASTDMLSRKEVILLTSEGRKVRCRAKDFGHGETSRD